MIFLYIHTFLFSFTHIYRKIFVNFYILFICTPLNIHSYFFSFKCYTIIRVSAFFRKAGFRTAENTADNQTRPGLFLRIDSTGLGDTGND